MSKRREVVVSGLALADMEEIFDFITEASGSSIAQEILEALERKCESLREFSERGNRPKEFVALGIGEYRELHHKPYRIIYEVTNGTVVVHTVLDGRRDVESLLQQRLLQRKQGEI